MNTQLSKFSSALFWDVDKNDLDWDKHARFVIERVAMRGLFRDWEELKKLYGLSEIKKALLNARYLDNLTLNFFSVIFDVPKKEFRCYIMKQSFQGHWDY